MFKEERKELQFEWSHLGDIDLGRPNLGRTTSVAAYRLMQYTVRDAAIKHAGVQVTDEIFRDAGRTAGKAIYKNLLGSPTDLGELVSRLQQALLEQGIGILRVEEADQISLKFSLTVAEDLDCSGLPNINEAICTYDEGFIAGILEAFTGREFEVREIDCWCTGAGICRFSAQAVG